MFTTCLAAGDKCGNEDRRRCRRKVAEDPADPERAILEVTCRSCGALVLWERLETAESTVLS